MSRPRRASLATLLLFAAAAEAAGRRRDTIDAPTLDELLEAAAERYGERFSEVVPHCRVMVNGETADPDVSLDAEDEVALLPPVSGGTVGAS